MEVRPTTLQAPIEGVQLPYTLTAELSGVALNPQVLPGASAVGRTLRYQDFLAAFLWYQVPSLDAPVRVSLSESLSGFFADAQIDVTYLPTVELDIGAKQAIDDELASDVLYNWRVSSIARTGGLNTYRGETLITDLSRRYPQAPMTLLPGFGGVPDPLTPRYVLERFCALYDIPLRGGVPEFYMRDTRSVFTPELKAFVLELPDDGSQGSSLYSWLERIFKPFRGYSFRADENNRLEIVPPPWLESNIESYLGKRNPFVGTSPTQYADRIVYPYPERRPTLRLGYSAFTPTRTYQDVILTESQTAEITFGEHTFRFTWNDDRINVEALQVGFFSLLIDVRPDRVTGRTFVQLTNADLAPDGFETEDLDGSYNQATVELQGYDFEPDQPIMQPSAIVVRAERFRVVGYTVGPPSRPAKSDVDEGYKVIYDGLGYPVGGEVLEASVFWPISDEVVSLPGSDIRLELELDEWYTSYERNTRNPSDSAGELLHQQSVTFDLPADGREHFITEIKYDKGVRGFIARNKAKGNLYARIVPGGVQIRVEHDPYGVLNNFKYIIVLFGLVIRLNGFGLAFTKNSERAQMRFGFSSDTAQVTGLPQAQALYGLRPITISAGMWVLDEAQGLRWAQAIVEEEYRPKRRVTYTLVPSGEGYRVKPWHVGRPAALPSGEDSLVNSWSYQEAHAPGQNASSVTVSALITSTVVSVRTGTTKYGRAAYRISHYERTS